MSKRNKVNHFYCHDQMVLLFFYLRLPRQVTQIDSQYSQARNNPDALIAVPMQIGPFVLVNLLGLP